MNANKEEFVRCMIEQEVLSFGDFTLKSGRRSPYFFNLGHVSTSDGLLAVGEAYADALLDSGLEPDVLFGPAYKGIPLVTAMAIALRKKGTNISVSFNRKEAKHHGEGGILIGASLRGRTVLLVDDVVTDGTQKRESARMIDKFGGRLIGVLVGLDRLEKDSTTNRTALEFTQAVLNVPVVSVVTLNDVIALLLSENLNSEQARTLVLYRENFC